MMVKKSASIIHITGLVQGVGFRPFIYRMAQKNQVLGWVENNNEGVTIYAEAEAQQMELFVSDIRLQAPKASRIENIHATVAETIGIKDFTIRKSENLSDAITEVSPDISVCDECLADMKQQPHRLDYPFINCTHCGPRFTIIKALPYDRHLTTMHPFSMCQKCRQEYENILDRRFHAQPVACLNCGPEYFIHEQNSSHAVQYPAKQLAHWIDQGKIVALKGLGGYHLLCSAENESIVACLRSRKKREGKPMAVMVPDLKTVKTMFEVSEVEAELLQSWQRPIVLLRSKVPMAFSVSLGLNTTGVMLPYMPLHFLLFGQMKTQAVVMTSGNLSDEPVAIDDADASTRLSSVADHIMSYNREIHNRADDSVCLIVNGQGRMIRRSRGYAPAPLRVAFDCEGIFAAGAELVNTFALGKAHQAILSQHIGDLKNAETLSFYEEAFSRFSALFRFNPSLVACDSHPDYLSSQFTRNLGLKTIEIQHHHAHLASCMAEHGLDEKVIGIALDGTGFGKDGTIWGGEFMVADLTDFDRKYYFDPVPLPGGDKVSDEPWRTAVGYLYKYFGPEMTTGQLPFLHQIDPKRIELVNQMLMKNINCPMSSGAGRLFDAVAALTGLCAKSMFHAEAPMRLESVIKPDCRGKYHFEVLGSQIVFQTMFHQMMGDIQQKAGIGEISAKFHNTIAAIILTIARRLREETGLEKVVLSGGTFQNRYLLGLTEQILKDQKFTVFAHRQVPSNDGGIALGQLIIAAKRRVIGLL